MAEMREYIQNFMSVHELSMAQLSELLGYKSKTSLVRLMEGSSREKTLIDFETAMNKRLNLSAEERAGLHRTIQIAIRGRAAFLAEEEMWRFVRGDATPGTDALSITSSNTGEPVDIYDHYAKATNIHITLLNCHSAAIFPLLKHLLAREDVTVEHYIRSDDNAAKTICAINSLLPVFYARRYSCFNCMNNPYSDATAPQGVMKADMMAVGYTLPDGTSAEDVIVFTGRSEGKLMEHRGRRGIFTEMLGLKRELYTPLKRTYFQCSSFENYVQFSADIAALERGRGIWKIKPDLGVDWLPVHILLPALEEGSMPEGALDGGVKEALIEIYSHRYRDTFSKHQPAHTVMKRGAMLRFVQTGRTSDHFWAMRPYTPRERVEILKLLLHQQQTNPFFHIYFLRDDDLLRDAEITLYDDLGILITESDTDYNLAEGHSEGMLTHPDLLRLFREFFLRRLVKHHALPEEDTCRFLSELIEIAEKL